MLDSTALLPSVPAGSAASADPAALFTAGLARTARELASGRPLRPLLQTIVEVAAEVLAAPRCLIYLHRPGSTELVGMAAHDRRLGGCKPGWRARARIPVGAAGLAGVLQRGEIVELPLTPIAAGEQLPAIGVRRCLVVPIPVAEQPGGVMVVDAAGANRAPATVNHEYARAFAALAGVAVAGARQGATAERRRQVLALRLRDERHLTRVEDELMRAAITSAGPAEIARFLATSLGLPCAVAISSSSVAAFDASGLPAESPRLLSPELRESRELAADLADLERDQARIVGPYPDLGVRLRHIVARVANAGAGSVLILGETGRAVSSTDVRLARRAAAVIAIELRSLRAPAGVEPHERESLVRDAVHGSDSVVSLRSRAAHVGIELDAPSVVCLISTHSQAADGVACEAPRLDVGEVRSVAASLGFTLAERLAASRGGIVGLIPVQPARPRHAAVRAVHEQVGQLLAGLRGRDGELLAAISSACRAAHELPRALTECRELTACLLEIGSGDTGPRILSADELGAGKLLLGQVSFAAAERFVQDTFGSLIEEEDGAKLLDTLDTFLAANHFVRATAARLGIHENTVRYRFRKLASATGLDVLGSADDQLTARLALTMHKLRSNAHLRRRNDEDQPRP